MQLKPGSSKEMNVKKDEVCMNSTNKCDAPGVTGAIGNQTEQLGSQLPTSCNKYLSETPVHRRGSIVGHTRAYGLQEDSGRR